MTAEEWLEHIDDLARRAQGGDPEAFDYLVRELTPRLFAFFRRKGEEETEDLVQETWLRVVKNLRSYNPLRHFPPWLLTIGHHLWIDRLRHRHEAQLSLATLIFLRDHPLTGDGEDGEDFEELINALEECMNRLKKGEREIVFLRYWEGLDLYAIARRMRQRYNSVRGKAFRAGKKLRECLERKGIRRS